MGRRFLQQLALAFREPDRHDTGLRRIPPPSADDPYPARREPEITQSPGSPDPGRGLYRGSCLVDDAGQVPGLFF